VLTPSPELVSTYSATSSSGVETTFGALMGAELDDIGVSSAFDDFSQAG